MSLKILVTTVATRTQSVSTDTQVIELDDYIDAVGAVKRINEQGMQYVDSAYFKQKAVPLNFTVQ